LAYYKYLFNKKSEESAKRMNVVKLIEKAKAEKAKEKRKNIIVVAAAISALAVSGLIISL